MSPSSQPSGSGSGTRGPSHRHDTTSLSFFSCSSDYYYPGAGRIAEVHSEDPWPDPRQHGSRAEGTREGQVGPQVTMAEQHIWPRWQQSLEVPAVERWEAAKSVWLTAVKSGEPRPWKTQGGCHLFRVTPFKNQK